MQVLNIFHVLIAIALCAFVLIQRGQGATAGAAFGSGASGTVFGARGAGNFLSKTTWVLAGLFCAISLTMAVLVSRMAAPETDLGVVSAAQEVAVPQDSVPAEPSVVSDEPLVTDIPQLDTQAQSVTAPADEAASENAATDETLPASEAEGATDPDDSGA